MTESYRCTSTNESDYYDQLISYLIFARPKEENINSLSEYFFSMFADQPAQYYDFLKHVRAHIETQKRTKKNKHLAQQYLDILSPLAERFGIFDEKNTIDTLCFKITNPKAYAQVQKVLVKYQKASDIMIKQILKVLQKLLKEHDFNCSIKGRHKTPYSIYKKIQKKKYGSPIHLYDIFAFRIICDDNDEDICYEILNVLHDEYLPLAHRFKDYITIPKINGYQSIHTCLNNVIPDLDLPIEIQLRTKALDDFAEKGLASHWLYSQSKSARLLTSTEQKLLAHLKRASDSHGHIHIFFFSIHGDMYMLPKSSTVLDFAYSIHTDLGKDAIGYLVNGKRQENEYEIQNGDRIEILTSLKDHASTKQSEHVCSLPSK